MFCCDCCFHGLQAVTASNGSRILNVLRPPMTRQGTTPHVSLVYQQLHSSTTASINRLFGSVGPEFAPVRILQRPLQIAIVLQAALWQRPNLCLCPSRFSDAHSSRLRSPWYRTHLLLLSSRLHYPAAGRYEFALIMMPCLKKHTTLLRMCCTHLRLYRCVHVQSINIPSMQVQKCTQAYGL